jgi:hypothetical protein
MFSVKPQDFYDANYGEQNSALSDTVEKLVKVVDEKLVEHLETARSKKLPVNVMWINTSEATPDMSDEIIGLATKVVVNKLIDSGFDCNSSKMGDSDQDHAINIRFAKAKK